MLNLICVNWKGKAQKLSLLFFKLIAFHIYIVLNNVPLIMAQHNDLGKEGEELAARFLTKQGYVILEKNYRFQKAEIDIIAQKDDVICAVEVKTRSTPEFGNPQDFVKPKQIKLLVKAINQYVEDTKLNLDVRFDIVAIIKNKQGTRLEHLKDAFYHF